MISNVQLQKGRRGDGFIESVESVMNDGLLPFRIP